MDPNYVIDSTESFKVMAQVKSFGNTYRCTLVLYYFVFSHRNMIHSRLLGSRGGCQGKRTEYCMFYKLSQTHSHIYISVTVIIQ